MNDQQTLWAFDRCTVYPLPENRVLVRNARTGRQAVLTPDVYHALTGCREFRTLDEHAQHLAAHNPALSGQQTAVQQVLESVRKDGLLISADIYPTLLQPSPQPVQPTDRPVAAIITWERPEALARCLESMRENCDLQQVERLYVIDDSRSEENQALSRSATAAFAEDATLPVHYLGAIEQQQFLERIVRKVAALEDAVRFLIDRQRWDSYWTSGLGRTVALLVSVGRRLLVLDDDILCEVFEPYSKGGEVSFSDRGREAAFYADNDEWQELRATRSTDPFARHTQVLGLGLNDALGALGLRNLDAVSFAGAHVEIAEKLRGDSPVLMTECGSLGDPGTALSNWLTGLDDASLERLLADDASVTNALNIRNCWSGRSTPHFGPHANMSQLTGLDNRFLLPPFIPIMRGEDRLFGSMVEFLFPGSLTLDSAWAVPHLPIPAREWTAENRAFSTSEPFPRFCLSLVAENLDASRSTDPMRRLGHLARLFEDLADLDHRRLSEHYMDKRLESKTRRFNHLKQVRTHSEGAPQAWLDYLDEAIKRLNLEMVDNPVDFRLRGYPEGLENEELTAWWQDFWHRFGHAIRAWPAIRQAARECAA